MKCFKTKFRLKLWGSIFGQNIAAAGNSALWAFLLSAYAHYAKISAIPELKFASKFRFSNV